MEGYIDDKKKLYAVIHKFLDNSDQNSNEDTSDQSFKILSEFFQKQNENNNEEIIEFLQIIKSISDHYHRDGNFLKKIKQILQHFQDQIKQSLSNDEIFHIFESNKLIVYFLLKSGIITISDQIYKEMINKVELNGIRYCHFFYPELKQFIGEEAMKCYKEELLLTNPDIFDNFDEKREEGENDSHLCSLIRQDLVEEFIQYVNRKNYSLSSLITPSIFETNSFLIDNKNPSLIEYAAFFGSIQIFQYLMMNKVELTPSLWLYSIHSKNAELIHLLESNKKEEDDSYIECFIESIKCHHNDIAKYFEDNLLIANDSKKCKEKIISNCIKYHNYFYFEIDDVINYGFFYLCLYNYNKAVDLLLKKKENIIKSKIISKTKQFNVEIILTATIQWNFIFNIFMTFTILIFFI